MLLTDQMGRTLSPENLPPGRIVSLVPSQTELLADLGLGPKVVGITKFCVHPASWQAEKKIVGGTKNFHLERIYSLKPDLVIGNKEENDKERIEELEKRFPVWMSDVHKPEDAFEMILSIGDLTGSKDKASGLVREIRQGFEKLAKSTKGSRKKVAYFIWQKPFMVAASDTFINEMLSLAGFSNVFEDRSRYPRITLQELTALRPEVILLSSEPFPFREKHLEQFRKVFPQSTCLIVDGELFSWYGSRMKFAPAYFEKLYRKIK